MYSYFDCMPVCVTGVFRGQKYTSNTLKIGLHVVVKSP